MKVVIVGIMVEGLSCYLLYVAGCSIGSCRQRLSSVTSYICFDAALQPFSMSDSLD